MSVALACVTPVVNLSINDNTVLCGGTYELNVSSGEGVLVINASNIELDCNNSAFIGNATGYAVKVYNQSNVTVLGCNATNYRDAFFFSFANNSYLGNSNAWDNYRGVYWANLNNMMINNISVRNSSQHGMFSNFAHNITIANTSVINSTIYGFNMFYSDNISFENVFTSSNDLWGFVLDRANAGYAFNVTSNDNNRGMYFYQSDDWIVRNSSFYNNSYGVYVYDAQGSVFYHNRFINNTIDQAYLHSSSQNNYFNTSVSGVAQGNYWSDIFTNNLLIYDTNATGFGDSGTDYPYNLTNGGNVSAYVVDWGPMAVNISLSDNDGDGDPDITDCDSNNASILSPRDDLYVTENTLLCPGTYVVDDVNADGVIRAYDHNVVITCNGTSLVGEGPPDSGSIGFYVILHSNVTFQGCNVSNYEVGFSLSQSYYSTVIDGQASNCTSAGILIGRSQNDTVQNFEIWNNSVGIYFWHQTQSLISNVTVYENQKGINLDSIGMGSDTEDNTMINSSLYDNDYGMYITADSDDNLFYHNTFSNNTLYHAYSLASNNNFNTSVLGVAQGNYWGDIIDLEIYDTTSTGWADSGIDYPYSLSNGGHVSSNVIDYGPATTWSVNCTVINSTILGSTVLQTTFYSRGCYLENSNVTYSTIFNSIIIDSVLNNTWAIDSYIENSSMNDSYVEFSNVINSVFCGVFEIFSAGIDGNQLAAGRVRSNGTDYYSPASLSQICAAYVPPYDPTPPTAPTVYDGFEGEEIDWFNDNSTVSAWWDGATEDISTIYYRYAIVLNGSRCIDDCNFTSVSTNTSVTVSLSSELNESDNVTFVVQAYNAYGLNSSNATSDGMVLDITDPAEPTVSSTTHPDQSRVYPDLSPLFAWNSSDVNSSGVLSGLAGYSYLLDQSPGSAPDSILDLAQLEIQDDVSPNVFGTLKQASATGTTRASFSELPFNVSAGDILDFEFVLAEDSFETDDEVEYLVYAIRKADTDDETNFDYDETANAVTEILNVSTDIRYSPTAEGALKYSASLTFNESVNESTSDVVYVVFVATYGIEYTNNLLAGFDDEHVDSSTRAFACAYSVGCVDRTNDLEGAMNIKLTLSGNNQQKQYNDLSAGIYYFHVRAKDNADNWGDVAHYNVTISTGEVSVAIQRPVEGQVFTNDTINVTVWTSEEADTYVIAYHPDGSNDTLTSVSVNGTYIFENLTLEAGTNILYAYANGTDNITKASAAVNVIYSPNATVTNKTIVVRYSQAGNIAQAPYLVYSALANYMIGIGTENPGASVASPIEMTADTSEYTVKILVTLPGASVSDMRSALADNDLLDEVNPAFGIERMATEYVIATLLNYPHIELSGFNKTASGVYNLRIINYGLTDDGQKDIRLVLT